jgi:DNA-binding NarL/FixJ family response regulator
VAECASAAEAARVVATERPDVVTLDTSLPDGNGLRVAREFRQRYPGLGIVILTSQDEDAVLFRAAEAGASAFVSKNAQADEVLSAIRHAAVAPASFTAPGLAAALSRRRRLQERLALSQRETEVLRLLGDSMSIPAISAAMCVSQSTAKTYVARLYKKLGAANRAQALMAAVRCSLIGSDQAAPASVAFIPAHRASQVTRPPAVLAS